MVMRKRLLISVAGWLVAKFVRLSVCTLRIHKEDINPSSNRFGKGSQGRIYCFWHEDMLSLANFFSDSGTHVLIGRGRDGGLYGSMIQALGFHTVCEATEQVESSAGLQITNSLQGASLGVASDGPLGPRREFQTAAILLAARTGMPLIPIGLAYDRPWHLAGRSKLVIPRPFSRVVVCANGPLSVPSGANREFLEAQRQKVAGLMQESSLRAESLLRRWRKGEKLPLVSPEAKASESVPLRKTA
jgi:lysophospholipid acyltransferase (LPLAT)-like uncharacterized protein